MIGVDRLINMKMKNIDSYLRESVLVQTLITPYLISPEFYLLNEDDNSTIAL